jgi:hypothetical protein
MLYMVTFTINIPPMLAYIPYMDPMGDVSSLPIFWRRKHDTSAWPGSGDAPEDGPMDLCRVQLDGVREGGFAGTSSSATLGVSQECLRFRMFHDVPHGFLSGVP